MPFLICTSRALLPSPFYWDDELMETSCPLDRIAENAFQVSPFYWDDELMETNLLIKIKVDSSPGSPFYWDDELMETFDELWELNKLIK